MAQHRSVLQKHLDDQASLVTSMTANFKTTQVRKKAFIFIIVTFEQEVLAKALEELKTRRAHGEQLKHSIALSTRSYRMRFDSLYFI